MNKKIKIAIILPSRGLVFAEVMEAIEKQRQFYDIKIYGTHNLPIPDCFNVPARLALTDPEFKPDYIWSIEEDTVPPPGQPMKMIETLEKEGAAATAVDYPCYQTSTICFYTGTLQIAFTGLGCFLIKPDALAKVLPLRTDIFWSPIENRWRNFNPMDKVYGYHDQYMGFRLNELKMKIVRTEGECRHLRFITRGEGMNNNGVHGIVEEKRIVKPLYLSAIPWEQLGKPV